MILNIFKYFNILISNKQKKLNIQRPQDPPEFQGYYLLPSAAGTGALVAAHSSGMDVSRDGFISLMRQRRFGCLHQYGSLNQLLIILRSIFRLLMSQILKKNRHIYVLI